MIVTNNEYVALLIYNGKKDKKLILGITHPDQELRLYMDELIKLNGCKSIILHRSDTIIHYDVVGVKVDFKQIFEVGIGISLILMFLFHIPLYLKVIEIKKESPSDIKELNKEIFTAFKHDIYLNKLIKRNPRFLDNLLKSTSLSSLVKKINK